jgi:hypothetical protein
MDSLLTCPSHRPAGAITRVNDDADLQLHIGHAEHAYRVAA